MGLLPSDFRCVGAVLIFLGLSVMASGVLRKPHWGLTCVGLVVASFGWVLPLVGPVIEFLSRRFFGRIAEARYAARRRVFFQAGDFLTSLRNSTKAECCWERCRQRYWPIGEPDLRDLDALRCILRNACSALRQLEIENSIEGLIGTIESKRSLAAGGDLPPSDYFELDQAIGAARRGLRDAFRRAEEARDKAG